MGERIRQARADRGWKQKNLAAEVSVEPITVSRWERGATTPDLQVLGRVAEATGKPLSYFVGDDGTTPRRVDARERGRPHRNCRAAGGRGKRADGGGGFGASRGAPRRAQPRVATARRRCRCRAGRPDPSRGPSELPPRAGANRGSLYPRIGRRLGKVRATDGDDRALSANGGAPVAHAYVEHPRP